MKKILGAVLFVLSAQFAFAAEVKPGLWEMEFDAQGMGPEAQAAMKQMESMPPGSTQADGGHDGANGRFYGCQGWLCAVLHYT